jgi:tripartite-type tricarboxylate transporter receptor subunit TctC
MMRWIHQLLATLITISYCLTVQAQSPTKPMRIIVPFAVGGASDTYTRLVAQKITEQTGKTVIVENKTGAGGRIAFDFVAHAAPDGLTVGLIDATYAMLPGLFPVLPWNIEKDLVPVVMVAQTPFVLVIGTDAKFSNYQQLTAAAKAQPGKLNYGSAGVGSVNHIVTERFRSNAKIDITHIPYKGMSEASVALLSGNVDLIVAASPTAIGQIKSGKVRPLFVTTANRSPALPDVPSVREVGLTDFVVTNWFGFAVPKATPKEMIDTLHKDVMNAVAATDVKEKLLLQGAEASTFSTQEFAEFVKNETRLWTQVIQNNGIKLEP